MTNNEMVGEFHAAFGNAEPDHPVIPTDDEVWLRFSLIKEEFEEVAEALGFVPETMDHVWLRDNGIHLPDLAKELADLLYVVYGTGRMFGIDLDAVFAEVHRSNMSKLGPDGKPVRRSDGKFLKGPHYTPADIAGVLERMFAEAH